MLRIHPNARTTPAVRAEIARSQESTGVLAQRFGVSTETIRKWRKRGPEDCLDHSARPHRLPWKASEEERAVVCALRRATNFALDDLTFVVSHFLPHLNRDSVWRILRAEGLSRRPLPSSDRPKRGQGRFRDYDLGFVHIDIKHLPKLQTGNGDRRKRMAWWSASTAGSAARCWASPSGRTRISSSCCAASTRPTTPVASACSTARRRTRSSPSASRPDESWPGPSLKAGPDPRTSPRHA